MSDKRSKREKQNASVKKIVIIALFVALSFAISLISFPIFPATPYLKLDFSNVFILLTGLLFGPVEGIIVCVLKEVLSVLTSSSGGVGELANAIMTSSFVLIPAVAHKLKPGTKVLIFSLIPACIVGTIAALLANRFIIFPLYMGAAAAEIFGTAFWYVVAFNLIKTAVISLLSAIMFKRLVRFVRLFKI